MQPHLHFPLEKIFFLFLEWACFASALGRVGVRGDYHSVRHDKARVSFIYEREYHSLRTQNVEKKKTKNESLLLDSH